jgi:hypothetical protein
MGEAEVFPGVCRAVVTDAEDPKQRGRVQVKVPSVSGVERAWAPVITHARGSFFARNQGTRCLSRSKPAIAQTHSSLGCSGALRLGRRPGRVLEVELTVAQHWIRPSPVALRNS